MQEVHVGAEEFLHGDDVAFPSRHRQQTRRVAGELELGEMRRTTRLATKHDGEREAEMREVREGMTGAQRHRQRRETRVDFVAAPCRELRTFVRCEIGPLHNMDARLGRVGETGPCTARLRLQQAVHLELHA